MEQLKQQWQKFWPSPLNDAPPTAPSEPPKTCACAETLPYETKNISPPSSSPLLRLPAELRLQIYSYLELDGHIISVLSKPISALNKEKEQLWYRIERHDSSDLKFSQRVRHVQLGNLFSTSAVCQQLRSEITPLLYASNSFLFSDALYDYAKSFPLFIASLSPSQLRSIRTIYWPLRQARDIQRFGIGNLDLPDRSCVEELRGLTGLKKVVLRFVATDVGAAKMNESEIAEMGTVDYAGDRKFRRELAVRGMREVLEERGGEVEIVCERISEWWGVDESLKSCILLA